MPDRRCVIMAGAVLGFIPATALAAEPGRNDADMVRDWPWLGRYAADNAQLIRNNARVDIVFIGDSITELWPRTRPDFFQPGWINRGIGGQTSPQILLRLMADVVALRPKAAHILAGTNDIAGNSGPISPEATVSNIIAMGLLARANGIRPVIGTIPPAAHFFWKPDVKPVAPILETNRLLRAEAKAKRLALVDYFAAIADATNILPREYGEDGVHPTARGYELMERALQKASRQFRS